VEKTFGDQAKRVAVADIETFVGQNISEIGSFNTEDTRATLAKLFDRYTKYWLSSAGSGGLRIIDPEARQE
jgi:hypothetical protein